MKKKLIGELFGMLSLFGMLFITFAPKWIWLIWLAFFLALIGLIFSWFAESQRGKIISIISVCFGIVIFIYMASTIKDIP